MIARPDHAKEEQRYKRLSLAASALTFATSLAAVLSTLGTTFYSLVTKPSVIDASMVRDHGTAVVAVASGAAGLTLGGLFKFLQSRHDHAARPD